MYIVMFGYKLRILNRKILFKYNWQQFFQENIEVANIQFQRLFLTVQNRTGN